MTMFMFGLSFVLSIVTTIKFNSCLVGSPVKDRFVLFTIIDSLKTFAFMSTLLSFFFRLPYIAIGAFVVFVIVTLIHLGFNKEEHEDITIVFQTWYNNIVVQVTLLLPFAIFSYLFRNLGSEVLEYILAFISTVLVFSFSLILKNLSKNVYSDITLKLEFASRYFMLLIYSVLSIVAIGTIITIMLTARVSFTSVPNGYARLVTAQPNVTIISSRQAQELENSYSFFNTGYEEDSTIIMSKTRDSVTKYYNVQPIFVHNMQMNVIRASILSVIMLFLPLATDCDLYLKIENMLNKKA